jgi:hypothetical protein
MPTTKKAASKSKKAPARPKSLNIATKPGSRLPVIVRNLERALGRIGCQACLSGINRIVIGDVVMSKIK